MISVSAIVPRFLVRILVLIDANFSEVNLSDTASMCSREITVHLISLLCIPSITKSFGHCIGTVVKKLIKGIDISS